MLYWLTEKMENRNAHGKFGLILLLIIVISLFGQQKIFAQDERVQVMQKRLQDLSLLVPGLAENADLSVSDINLQDFLRALAATHNLNLTVDPTINPKVSLSFTSEKVLNVLLYIVKQYNLDLTFVGSIISVRPFLDPLLNIVPLPKMLLISFDPNGALLSFDLHDDTLGAVAKRITQITNRNIIVLPSLINRKVTGFVQKLPVPSALEKLALAASFKLNLTNDSVFILEPLKADEEIVSGKNHLKNTNYSIRKVIGNPNGPIGSAIEVSEDSSGKRMVSLNVVNSPIKDVVKSMADQARINYFEYSDLQGNTTATVFNMEFERALAFVLQDTKYTFAQNSGVFLIGERKNEGLRVQKLVQLHNRSADSLLDFIPGELKQGVELREFKELNGILLSGAAPQVTEIEAFLKQIDKVVPMIALDVIILDVNKNRSVSSGLTAGVSDTVKPGGTLVGANGINYTFGAKDINSFLSAIGINSVFNLGKVSPNFYVTLTAMENRGNVDQRQTPKLSTLNGHAASLSIGNTQYYAVSTQNVLGSLNPQTVVTQQFIPVEANLLVDIIPYVAGNDEVTMHIGVSISNFTSSSTSINQPPPTSTSKFKSIIRVHNEDMIVLGGIERTVKSESSSGVPILSRIPILKWVFGTHSKTTSKVVSIVFIKPTILYQ